ncbi:MAG: hypothetical protein AAFV53_35465 [Myxococcota bacterium]
MIASGASGCNRQAIQAAYFVFGGWWWPVSLAVGLELMVDDRVYVVEKVDMVDDTEMVTLVASDGSTLEEPIVREDPPENSQELQGSELPENDTTTPGVEGEA